MRYVKIGVVASISICLALAGTASAGAVPAALQLNVLPAIPMRAVSTVGETFADIALVADEHRGQINTVLSGGPTGSGDFIVDDQIDVSVTRPDGSSVTLSHNFNRDGGCGGLVSTSSVDLSQMLQRGRNFIHISLRDTCGSVEGSTSRGVDRREWRL